MLWFHAALVLPCPPAEEKCARPFPNVANGTGHYSILRRGYQLVIPALSFTGCGQTLRWHVRGREIPLELGRGNSFRFTLKLWRPTPSGSYTEVRPKKSLTSSVHLSSLSARIDYRWHSHLVTSQGWVLAIYSLWSTPQTLAMEQVCTTSWSQPPPCPPPWIQGAMPVQWHPNCLSYQ